MKPRALIFGATGQDGPYLATLLEKRGYDVWGCIPGWDPRKHTLRERAPNIQLIEGDLNDPWLPMRVLDHVEPDAIYNLAAITFVPQSWEQVELTIQSNGSFPMRMLEAIRTMAPKTRFYQASTSEMFGASAPPQHELTPFLPVSPYAAAKLLAHHAVHVYRTSYDLFAVSGILFNHESPWRGPEFVTRHVTRSVARMAHGQIETAPIGRLDTWRDWGHAQDYVEAMVMMMEANDPDDFVIGTGEMHTVAEVVQLACSLADVDAGRFLFDDSRLRPAETAPLQANAGKAFRILGWEPSYSFEALITEMVEWDLVRAARGEL